jgi:hypothetical protein
MKLLIAMSAIIAAVGAGFALYVGFQHNPQMKFFDTETGIINYRHSFLTFAVWFSVIFTPLFFIGLLARAIAKR